jgi:hypothetical protein
MTPDAEYDALAAELTALGRTLPEPAPSAGLAVVVMERLADAPPPPAASVSTRVLRRASEDLVRHRRRVAVAVTAVLLALLAAPPVRAAVADWFGFAGVSVRLEPTPGPSTASPPPTLGETTGLEEAGRLVAFTPVVPTELGSPDGVQVSADRRLLSMSWDVDGVGAVRLDQFDGRLDYTFAKTAPGVEFISVAGGFALWFDRPHEVVVLNRDGTRRTETARLAGNTLIWEHGDTALRLEGDLSRARAVDIASSVAAVP